MHDKKIIRIYAKALAQLCIDNKEIHEELERFCNIFMDNKEVACILRYSSFTIEEKYNLLEDILENEKFSDLAANIVKFILLERKMDIFLEIYRWMEHIIEEKAAIYTGIIEGSVENVEQVELDQIISYIQKIIKGDLRLTYRKNERITAGYHIQLGDLQLDATIDNQLNRLLKD
ncbi:MAG: F0F1 ATP synthase subunit delta [Bacteriovoracaceae bacterium]|nr:F0F1 ATP synthase subunit delta [Bacteriovoracaceae bacterium]